VRIALEISAHNIVMAVNGLVYHESRIVEFREIFLHSIPGLDELTAQLSPVSKFIVLIHFTPPFSAWALR
jgi:hypothetical protein